MVFWRPQKEQVFIFVASSTIAIVLIILACCHRLEKKQSQESSEYQKSISNSKITEDSERDRAAQFRQDITRKANINEGYTVAVVDNGTKLISSAENGKDNGQVLDQAYNNKEGIKGLTRLNHDGSMDTRF